MTKAIGGIEFRSLSKGIEVCDLMVKKSYVTILISRPICPGKFLVIISGDSEEVYEAISTGKESGHGFISDTFLINGIDERIVGFLKGKREKPEEIEALGTFETTNVSMGIVALDKALKFSNIDILKINMAFGIGGKLIFIVSGSVSDVEEGIKEALKSIDSKKLIHYSIIPSPSSLVIDSIL
ncbi:BMC domain-containing protein [Clostridium hydrogeniformans]|uniref:BMC domain-containing protein n=1 Tax=Clostridium hydrogeniformans TaxID=349933 RepID=UPI0004898F7A|nr:BMC domain-containing protein [Clostridium hydrogeniformans]